MKTQEQVAELLRDPVEVDAVPAAHHGHRSNMANITIDPWHLHSLDLRQYGAVTARDLERLPDRCTRLQALGPYFAPPLTAISIVEALRPLVHLTHLHLDLSQVGRRRLDGVLLLESERDTMIECLWNQLNQCPLLEHLTLRMPPTATLLSTEEQEQQQQQQQQEQPGKHNCDMPGDGLARVARQIRYQPSCCGSLRSLNLDGNFIGDAGVRALVQTIMSRSSSSCCLQHLSLANNQLTSRACSQLVLLLVDDNNSNGNSKLQSLDLSHNDGIGLDGFFVLIRALQVNTALRHIAWMGCEQLERGIKEVYHHLLDLLEKHNTTLTWTGVSVSQSNNNDMQLQQQQRELDYWLLLNRTGRHLLQRDENDDRCRIPSGLWPHILARAAQIGALKQNQQISDSTTGPTISTCRWRNPTSATVTETPNSLFFLLRNTVGRSWAGTEQGSSPSSSGTSSPSLCGDKRE